MSAWRVELGFSEGSSNKFWRARVEGGTLYVNYGRIGSDGQTQIKELGSPAAAEKELEKLEREKRKKGYEDLSAMEGAGGEEEEEEGEEDEEEEERPRKKAAAPAKAAEPAKPAEAPKPAVPAAPAHADYAVAVEGRTVDVRLSRDGAVVRTVVVERYASPEEALAAFDRLKAQMVSDGYGAAPARDGL